MIVFTIYKNGGNAGALGASFSCAVFGVRGSSGGNAGVNAGTLASLCSACRAESVFKATAGLSVCVSTVSFGLQRRGFCLFGNLGRQNVRRFIGRALFNGCGFVRFDWGNRFSWSFCQRAVVFAVLNEDSRT